MITAAPAPAPEVWAVERYRWGRWICLAVVRSESAGWRRVIELQAEGVGSETCPWRVRRLDPGETTPTRSRPTAAVRGGRRIGVRDERRCFRLSPE